MTRRAPAPLLAAALLALCACQQWEPATADPAPSARFEPPETPVEPPPPVVADLSVACRANANLLRFSLPRRTGPAPWRELLTGAREPLPPEALEAHRACLASLDVPRVEWGAGAAGR